MEEKGQRNLAEISRNISGKLLDSVNLLGILEDLLDGEPKESTLIYTIKGYVKESFEDIEKCRRIISIAD